MRRGISARTSPPRGIDLLALPTGTRLRLGATAVVEITGLRNPCIQLDTFKKGLMAATLDKDADGNLIRKAGVMSIVISEGDVRPGDAIRDAELPDLPQPLRRYDEADVPDIRTQRSDASVLTVGLRKNN